MATSADIANLYATVVRTVNQDLREELINMGVDEQVLFDLQSKWEQKLLASKSFNPNDYPMAPRDNPGTTGGFVYRDGLEPFSRAAVPAQIPQFVPPNMVPGYGMTPVRLNPMVTRPYFSSQAPPQTGQPENRPAAPAANPAPRDPTSNNNNNIPQFDGADDDELLLVDNVLAADNKQVEDELGSDLDDETDDADDDKEADNLLLSLYEKVSRTKNKWKTIFKSGIVSIEGRDYAFNRLLGEFEW